MRVDGARLGLGRESPHFVEQLLARLHAPGPGEQAQEQLELGTMSRSSSTTSTCCLFMGCGDSGRA